MVPPRAAGSLSKESVAVTLGVKVDMILSRPPGGIYQPPQHPVPANRMFVNEAKLPSFPAGFND